MTQPHLINNIIKDMILEKYSGIEKVPARPNVIPGLNNEADPHD